jgi:hypothetical protein
MQVYYRIAGHRLRSISTATATQWSAALQCSTVNMHSSRLLPSYAAYTCAHLLTGAQQSIQLQQHLLRSL